MGPDDEWARWGASGAMALTGRPNAPLGPPAGFLTRLDALAAQVTRSASELGASLPVDGLALLTERAAISGFRRQGSTSCGGATRLLPATDGWLAVSLSRSDDLDLLPAWLGIVADGDPWTAVAAAVRPQRIEHLERSAVELGLPVAAVPAHEGPTEDQPVHTTRLSDARRRRGLDGVVVVDLSSLWAGPLCGSLLADAGATVVKVESSTRPDGARQGPRAFFDLLNAGKRSVALDFGDPRGVAALRLLVANADVVIEGSRPRALAQLGIDAAGLLRDGRPQVWISITGHGRSTGARDRVGFGDDAAAAGGLLAWDEDGPCFVLDAVADPLSGLVATGSALALLRRGGSWLVDVALARTARAFAGSTTTGDTACARPPVARRDRGTAPHLGDDTTDVLRDLGIGA